MGKRHYGRGNSGGQRSAIEHKLNRITVLLIRLLRAQGLELELEIEQMFNVQRLVDQSKRLTDAVAANRLVIQGLVDAAREVADDPEQLEAVFAETEKNIGALAQAPLVNTPADPGTPLPEIVRSTGGASDM